MRLPLKSTQQVYEFVHESGYNFTVTASYDSEFRCWSASVSMGASEYVTPEDAVKALARSAGEFVKRVEEAE